MDAHLRLLDKGLVIKKVYENYEVKVLFKGKRKHGDLDQDDDLNPGLSRAVRAFDQLGFIFEIGEGERYPETPPIR